MAGIAPGEQPRDPGRADALDRFKREVDIIAELEHPYVLPAFQGQGIGARLLDLAKRLSPRRLRLRTFQANRPARDFYEARGFLAVEFGDGAGNEERAPDVLYEWTGPA